MILRITTIETITLTIKVILIGILYPSGELISVICFVVFPSQYSQYNLRDNALHLTDLSS